MRPLFRLATRRTDFTSNVDEEFRHHVQACADFLEAGGMRRADAEEEAIRRFGSANIYHHDCVAIGRDRQRKQTTMEFLDSVRQDLAFAGRAFRRHLAFATSVVLTLCLGIGASAAIFTVVDATMLRPLPFTNPTEIVELQWKLPNKYTLSSMSAAPLRAVRAASPIPIAAATRRTGARTDVSPPEPLGVAATEPAMFPLLGVEPVQGRAFDSTDAAGTNGPVVMLSASYARRAFPDGAVGQRIRIDDIVFAVIGVARDDIRLPWFTKTEAWVPMRDDGSTPGFAGRVSRVYVAGRLGPLPVEAATSAFDARIVPLIQDGTLRGVSGVALTIADAHQNADVRRALWVLLGAVGMLWLIAIVNGTNLFLVRNSARQSELGVRLALGASRGRVVRQILTEALVLAIVAGVLSAGVAAGGIQALRGLLPAEVVAFSAHDIAVTSRVVAFVFVVSVLSGLLFGVAPALRAVGGSALSPGTRTTTAGRGIHAARNALIVGQIGIAVMLLVGGGLLTRSFMRLSAVDGGFDVSNVLTMTLSLPSQRYANGEGRVALRDQVLERLRATPGVVSATEGGAVPSHAGFSFGGDSVQTDAGAWHVIEPEHTWIATSSIDEHYFTTLRIPMVAGRDFAAADRGDSAVTIIDEGLARTLFGAGAAVGRQIRFDADGSWLTIVGVAGDTRLLSPSGSPGAHSLDKSQTTYEQYLPYPSRSAGSHLVFAVRTSGGGIDGRTLRRIVADVDPLLPVAEIGTLAGDYADTIAKPRFNSLLMMLLAAVATLLTVVGVYGVLSFTVAQRTREIGIRMALGATQGSVRRSVVSHALLLCTIGVALGVVASVSLSGLLRSLLYEVAPTDVVTFAAVAVLMLATGAAAAFVPSRRATRVDPMLALRAD